MNLLTPLLEQSAKRRGVQGATAPWRVQGSALALLSSPNLMPSCYARPLIFPMIA